MSLIYKYPPSIDQDTSVSGLVPGSSSEGKMKMAFSRNNLTFILPIWSSNYTTWEWVGQDGSDKGYQLAAQLDDGWCFLSAAATQRTVSPCAPLLCGILNRLVYWFPACSLSCWLSSIGLTLYHFFYLSYWLVFVVVFIRLQSDSIFTHGNVLCWLSCFGSFLWIVCSHTGAKLLVIQHLECMYSLYPCDPPGSCDHWKHSSSLPFLWHALTLVVKNNESLWFGHINQNVVTQTLSHRRPKWM